MFDVRLRLMGDNGTTKRAVLPTLDIDVTQVDSSTPTISFAVSEKIAGRMDAPQVVAIEYSTGGPFAQPRNGLFMVSVDDADDADTEGTVRFTGQGYVSWMLARTYLHWAVGSVNGERLWSEAGFPASAGTIMGGMLVESQNRGWGSSIARDFTPSVDSSGSAWTAAEKVRQMWRLLTPLSAVLGSITDQGLCDWWTEGTKLRLFRPGAGVVRENLVLGGPAFSARPTKSSFDDVFTNLTVVPEKAREWLYLENAGASTRFGRLEATLTQSGVADHATATTLAQTALVGGRAVKREYSFDWTPASGGPVPWDQFNVGDVVTSKTRHGKTLQRVIGIQVSKKDAVTVRVIVGDKLLTLAAKTAKRASSATIGGAIGGGGASFPIPDATFPEPSAPTGLHVVSNTALWRDDGTAQSTVTLGWSAVSQADDGSAVDVRGYEIAQRTALTESVVFATTEALETTTSEWAPSVARFVKVRAVAFDGSKSEWSEEISVTPIMPSSIVPKAPVGLAVASNVGVFQSDGSSLSTVTVTWTPVTQSVENVLVDIAEYEVAVGLDTHRVTGATATFTVPSGKLVSVRVRALTTLGVWGDPSTVLNVTGAVPAAVLAAPTAPVLTTGQGIVFAAWGGTLVNGTPPVGFQHVVAELALTATGPWTRVGTPIPKGGGGVNIRGVAGETVWVRFTPIDTLGRPGAVSASASIVVKAVEVGDIDQAITDAIEQAGEAAQEAQYTADGKNRIYSSAAEPVAEGNYNGPYFTTFTQGDRWDVLDPANPARVIGVKTWDGTQWNEKQIVADSVLVPGSVGGTVIKDGAVTSSKVNAVELWANAAWIDLATVNVLRAGVIQVDMLAPNVGESLNLSANESVSIIVGRQDDLAGEIADIAGDVSDAQATADGAASTAAGAQSAASGAQASANAAASEASDVGARLDQHQTYYRFGVGGLAIGDPGANSELRLKPDRIEMTQNGVTVSYWEGGVFVADEVRLKQASIANHQWLPYGDGRSVLRPL